MDGSGVLPPRNLPALAQPRGAQQAGGRRQLLAIMCHVIAAALLLLRCAMRLAGCSACMMML
jgi:hypothetical protein